MDRLAKKSLLIGKRIQIASLYQRQGVSRMFQSNNVSQHRLQKSVFFTPQQKALFNSSLQPDKSVNDSEPHIENQHAGLSAEFNPKTLSTVSDSDRIKYEYQLKSRDEHLSKLKDPSQEFDILIIGGGANGTGVVLDAAARGLKCAVIDSYDFAAGTSSKSTKMAHGGIRYFQQMCYLQGDPVESYNLIKETLSERSYFLQAAPYLIRELRLLIPHPSLLWTALWYWPGAFAYHLIYLLQVRGSKYEVRCQGPSLVGKQTLMDKFPGVAPLHGQYGAIMSEAQMHDSRMALNSLFTSSIDEYIPGQTGATLANYVELKRFIKDEDGKIIGGTCVDKMDPEGKEFNVKAKVVINCAGVHADEIRKMDKPDAEQRMVASRGTHLIFKKGMLEENYGIVIPETSDGRLIFILNYQDHVLAGTTDEFCDNTHHCEPSQEEIDFICKELKPYLGHDYDYKGNLLSAWAGLRPLVKESTEEQKKLSPVHDDSNTSAITKGFQTAVRWLAKVVHVFNDTKKSSASFSRNHVIETTDSGLVSLMGGKWTSYRAQGEETVDEILKQNPGQFSDTLTNAEGQTLNFNLIGSYSREQLRDGKKHTPFEIFQDYEDHLVEEHSVPRDTAKHLVREHGTSALRVLQADESKEQTMTRLHEDYPFVEGEVLHAIRSEMAIKPNDVLCRRVPVSFIDQAATRDVFLPKVVEIMAKELNWTLERKENELKEALEGLASMK